MPNPINTQPEQNHIESIVGEYIGKIYIETKERPGYNIESILMD